MMNQRHKEAPMSTKLYTVPCTVCSAVVGKHCVTSTGKYTTPHTSRLTAMTALKASQAKPARKPKADKPNKPMHDPNTVKPPVERREHKECAHESTKAARAACRRARATMING